MLAVQPFSRLYRSHLTSAEPRRHDPNNAALHAGQDCVLAIGHPNIIPIEPNPIRHDDVVRLRLPGTVKASAALVIVSGHYNFTCRPRTSKSFDDWHQVAGIERDHRALSCRLEHRRRSRVAFGHINDVLGLTNHKECTALLAAGQKPFGSIFANRLMRDHLTTGIHHWNQERLALHQQAMRSNTFAHQVWMRIDGHFCCRHVI